MLYDLLIIGAGPAGLTGAIYTARAGLKTFLVGRPQDSGLFSAHNVQNYPGFPDGIAGPELLNLFLEQARKHGTEFETKKEVVSIKSSGVPGTPDDPGADFLIILDGGEEYFTKRVLIASGRVSAFSGIKSEKELRGKGVHYCVACDGPLYKGKKVAVVGNKDFALAEAKELLSHTSDVTVISHAAVFEGRAERKKELEHAGVRFIAGRVKLFQGEPMFQSLTLDSGDVQTYDGVFMALGSASALSFAQSLGLAMEGDYLRIDKATGKTSMQDVYAAGCACEEGYGQIVKSAGEGATAALEIIKDLKGLKNYVDHT